MKPFKPPTLLRKPFAAVPPQPGPSSGSSSAGFPNRLSIEQPLPLSSEPPSKKRRISRDEDVNLKAVKAAAHLLKKPTPKKGFVAPQRVALTPVQNVHGLYQSQNASDNSPKHYYTVLWRRFTMKKNKTWDGDGVLSVSGTSALLQDISGKELGRGVCKGPLLVGSELSIAGKDVEVESMIAKDDFTSGRVFLGKTKAVSAPSPTELAGTIKFTSMAPARPDKTAASQKDPSISATGPIVKTTFKTPLLQGTVQVPGKNMKMPVPRHDPTVPHALVMKRPTVTPKNRQLVDIVVDPLLSRSLRPHQREGVSFLYECVMGMKDYGGEGAILADEMGLGKTLQTIALLWTLLKQNPIYEAGPVVKKALIVCPVSLIRNWVKEFRKWLGNERIGVFVAGDKHMRLTDFTKGKQYQVMIIGYEKLTKVQDQLQGDCGIDIVIADEGHRLKTAKNKAAAAIKSINTDRRIILSGTPIQNDLEEFYQMIDFINPNVISKYATFKREFETPILKSRQPEASPEDVEKGQARSEELASLTGMFVLRRTAEVLAQYLPPKTEYVLFCRPTEAQATVYRTIIGSQSFIAAMNSPAAALELINVLKKVCNCPTLLTAKDDNGKDKMRSEFIEGVPRQLLKERGASGKLQVLDSLLHQIRPTGEKVVLISNYTATMDILSVLLASLGYSYIRLDGSTQQAKRQDLVDRFNRSPQSNSFVFLLSAKAGGVGLNLIGASRLILFDLDWNPATDAQAMARVHRDGQKRPCFIYRLLTQGALDEKIFQRQVSKTGLADSIVDGKANTNGFTQRELRDLFTLDDSTDCQTHKLLGCTCGGSGMPVAASDENKEPDPLSGLAALDAGDDIEVVRLDEDEDDEQASQRQKHTFVKMKDYDPDAEEAEFRRTANKGKMLSLMQYIHLDTSQLQETDVLETAISDPALRSALREPGRRISFVFIKTNRDLEVINTI